MTPLGKLFVPLSLRESIPSTLWVQSKLDILKQSRQNFLDLITVPHCLSAILTFGGKFELGQLLIFFFFCLSKLNFDCSAIYPTFLPSFPPTSTSL